MVQQCFGGTSGVGTRLLLFGRLMLVIWFLSLTILTLHCRDLVESREEFTSFCSVPSICSIESTAYYVKQSQRTDILVNIHNSSVLQHSKENSGVGTFSFLVCISIDKLVDLYCNEYSYDSDGLNFHHAKFEVSKKLTGVNIISVMVKGLNNKNIKTSIYQSSFYVTPIDSSPKISKLVQINEPYYGQIASNVLKIRLDGDSSQYDWIYFKVQGITDR